MPRFTSHGEVCYAEHSNGKTVHPFWQNASQWWPGELKPVPQQQQSQQNPAGGCNTCNKPAVPTIPTGPVTLESEYDRHMVMSTNMHEHMPKLRELASQCDHVTELSSWLDGALTALAAGRPKKLVSVCGGEKPEWALWHDKKLSMGDGHTFESRRQDPLAAELEPTDLLYISTIHQAVALTTELERYAPLVRRWIVLHNTSIFGETGDNGGPGLLPALRLFVKAHTEWTVFYHTDANHGLMVISRDPRDKPTVPGTAKQLWNFSKALGRMALTAVKGQSLLVSEDVAAARLDTCSLCPLRAGDQCSKCGCYLVERPIDGGPGKTLLSSEACPIGKWPSV